MQTISAQCITQLLPAGYQRILIAYSGGMDSQVLLHLCASVPQLRDSITAIHIHHGLQKQADSWAEYCRQQSATSGVKFTLIKVDAHPYTGESPEAAARAARYQALSQEMQAGDVLLLGQHREDQLETVLLQLFRGGGIAGLAAMPASMPFATGTLLRPLLSLAKQEIQAYAIAHQLSWVDDPSNFSTDYDRNFLRLDIIPLLKQRWPSLDKAVARTAEHCAAANHLLNTCMAEHLHAMLDQKTQSLSLLQWQQYDVHQQHGLLRLWLQNFGLQAPSQAALHALIQQVILARADANPQQFLQGWTIRRYRQRLYAMPQQCTQAFTEELEWSQAKPTILLNNAYQLSRIPAHKGIAQQLWQQSKITLQPRSGGEVLQLQGRRGHHSLKKLFQEAAIPPWERDSRPLIYINGRLAAVAGLWVAAWAWSKDGDCFRIDWQYPTSKI